MTATFDPIPGVVQKDHQMPTRDGSSITVRVYTPEGKTDCPLAIIFHGVYLRAAQEHANKSAGGGYCIGGLENEELLCRRAAASLGCIVLNVDYRLAPEHVFPVPGNDCYDSLKWVRCIADGRKNR